MCVKDLLKEDLKSGKLESGTTGAIELLKVYWEKKLFYSSEYTCLEIFVQVVS